MDAGGSQTYQHIASGQLGAVDLFRFVHDAHGEPSQVVLVLRIETGHLGSLAADEGAFGLAAAISDAGNDLFDAAGDVLAAGDVVQEKQGLCAAADNVIDAHGYAVDAHRVMLVQQKGDLQLGAYAIGAGDQNGAGHTGQIGGELAAEVTDAAQDAINVGGLNQGLDLIDHLIAGSYVYASGGVGIGFTVLMQRDPLLKILDQNISLHFVELICRPSDGA